MPAAIRAYMEKVRPPGAGDVGHHQRVAGSGGRRCRSGSAAAVRQPPRLRSAGRRDGARRAGSRVRSRAAPVAAQRPCQRAAGSRRMASATSSPCSSSCATRRCRPQCARHDARAADGGAADVHRDAPAARRRQHAADVQRRARPATPAAAAARGSADRSQPLACGGLQAAAAAVLPPEAAAGRRRSRSPRPRSSLPTTFTVPAENGQPGRSARSRWAAAERAPRR